MSIVGPELSAISDTAVTVAFATRHRGGPEELDAEVVLERRHDRQRRIVSCPAPEADTMTGARVVRIGGLSPETAYAIEIRGGRHVASHDGFFPPGFRTLPTPQGAHLATIATVSDLHFGERVCGLGPTGREEPTFHAADEDPPYWMYVNEAIVREVNEERVDAVVVKGDLTGEGLAAELGTAAGVLNGLDAPWHAVLGNHDVMHDKRAALDILSQPDTPARTVEIGGVRLVLVDTVVPEGGAGGSLPSDRRDALDGELADAVGSPTLCFAHHYVDDRQGWRPVPGIHPADSDELLQLLRNYPRVGGWFAGHSHTNLVRHYKPTGSMPHVEVCATKDYPTGWALYRIHEGGYLQELRRCRAPAAAGWAHRTKGMFSGLYRGYALGELSDRCFTHPF